MNKSIYTLVLTALLAGTIFTSCDSASKEENEKKEMQQAKQESTEVQQEANAETVKAATSQEWKVFKSEAELTIAKNEVRITELRIKLQKPGKVLDPLYVQQIEVLKEKNAALRTRMANYDSKQTDWEKFKTEFNHDMDELGQALKDLSVDNKN